MRQRKALMVLLFTSVFLLLAACMSKASYTFQNQNLDNYQHRQQDPAQDQNSDNEQEQTRPLVSADAQVQMQEREQEQERDHNPEQLHRIADNVLPSIGNIIAVSHTRNAESTRKDENISRPDASGYQHVGSNDRNGGSDHLHSGIDDRSDSSNDEYSGGNSPDIPLTAPRLIAHAGGDIYGIRMTNSLQALDRSYEEGFRFIEVDICLTSDGVPVLLHDWGNANWFAGIGYSTEQPHWVE